jgi:hypothetical protein
MFLQQRLITLWMPLTKVVTVVVVVVTIFLFVSVWPVVVCHSCCICVCLARSGHNTTFGLVSINIFFGCCNIDEEDSLVFPTDIGSILICLQTRDNIDIQKQITTRIREMLKTQTQYTYLCSFSNL